MLKPGTAGGGVTVKRLQPPLLRVITGADGADGKTTTLTVLLSQPVKPVPSGNDPQDEV
jgi:hypothetical protein